MSNNGRMDAKQKIWNICDILRKDGMHIGTYVEQLTVLLFLKMMDERERFGEEDIEIPEECQWGTLQEKRGEELLNHYNNTVIPTLGQQDGILGDIFARVNSQFRTPVNLNQAIQEIDEVNWNSMDVDVKGSAYESLLERYAEEAKGAGQYFTPRAAIKAIVKAIDPGPDDRIHDPAAGTGGFLIHAFEHILDKTDGGMQLSRERRVKLTTENLTGIELIPETRRLGLMNLALHDIQPENFNIGDSLATGEHVDERYDVIMTNPPYGGNQTKVPARDDFIVESKKPELNFIQHAITLLRDGGQCGMVVPDGVLAVQNSDAEQIRRQLTENINLHTILILPEGAFHPYTGITTNIIFFDNSEPTEEVWFYDLRTNVEKIKKSNPLTDDHFIDFLENYNSRDESSRYFKSTLEEIRSNDYNLNYKRYKEFESDAEVGRQNPDEMLTELLSIEENLADQTEAILAILGTSLADESEVSDRWQWKELENLGDIHTGSTPRRSNSDYWNGEIPWVSPKDMGDLRISETEDAMTDLALSETSSNIIPEGSVLMVTRSSILEHTFPVALADVDLTINQDMKAIIPNEAVDSEYLALCLRAFADDILQECSKEGTTVASLDSDSLYSYRLPLPPLWKQEEIAERLLDIHQKMVEVERDTKDIVEIVDQLPNAILKQNLRTRMIELIGEEIETEQTPIDKFD